METENLIQECLTETRYIKARSVILSLATPLILVGLFVFENDFFYHKFTPYQDITAAERRMVSAALGLLIYVPVIFLNRKARSVYLTVVTSILSLIFIAQYLSYKILGGFIQISALKYAWMAGGVADSIWAFLDANVLIFLIPMIVVFISGLITKKEFKIYKPSTVKTKFIIFYLVLMSIVGSYGYLLRREYSNLSLLRTDGDPCLTMGKMGIVNYTMKSIVLYCIKGRKPTNDDRTELKNQYVSSPQYQKGINLFGVAKGRNLVIVQVESLEDVVVNKRFDDQEITPVVNKLVTDGAYFPNYYAQIGPGTTADAEFSVMNSLYPLNDDVAFVNYASDVYYSFPQLLKKFGYNSYSLHYDIPAFWNRSNMYRSLGYDHWYMRSDYNKSSEDGFFRLSDEEFFNQSIPKIAQFPQPFMALLMTFSSHTPYYIPSDKQLLNIPAKMPLKSRQGQYLQTIHYTDQTLGGFMEQLKQLPSYKNSLIVIYGDHGSFQDLTTAFGESASTLAQMHNTHVPLIILAPGLDLKGRFTQPASHVDLYPTLANLLGIEYPRNLMGHDLFNNPDPIAIHRNASGAIDAYMASSTAYEAAMDGVFEHGQCMTWPAKEKLDVNVCHATYDRETARTQASDIAVRKNLIGTLLGMDN